MYSLRALRTGFDKVSCVRATALTAESSHIYFEHFAFIT
jgi:hypothetical protein